MKRQKQFQTVVLLGIFLLFGVGTKAQQIWEVPMTYYENGQKRSVFIKEGKKLKKAVRIGSKLYYENGTLWRETGKDPSSGKYFEKQYYKNGQLGTVGMTDGGYLHIKKKGEWKSYYENGQLWQVVSNRDEYGFPIGDYKEYYATGILKATGKIDGYFTLLGIWTFYNENGEVEKTEDFGKGKEKVFDREDIRLFISNGIGDEMKEFDLLKRFKN